MRKALHILAQLFVGLFFFWHVAAIGTFALPSATQHVIAKPVRAFLVSKVFGPYILALSQWQQWNLFSPDPLRRVSRYRIERQLPDGQWQIVESIVPGTYEWWRHSTHFKMFIGLLEGDQDTYRIEIVRHFLMQRCRVHQLPTDTPIRITYVQYILSRPKSVLAAMRPDPWPPKFIISSNDPEYCP